MVVVVAVGVADTEMVETVEARVSVSCSVRMGLGLGSGLMLGLSAVEWRVADGGAEERLLACRLSTRLDSRALNPPAVCRRIGVLTNAGDVEATAPAAVRSGGVVSTACVGELKMPDPTTMSAFGDEPSAC